MSYRRSFTVMGLLGGALALLLALSLLGATPKKGAKAAGGAAAQIKRGQYLVGILGCGDCHTPGTFYGAPDFSRMLSGSELGWKGPWGVTYARNLTSDRETGIGSWSEDDIVKAIRTGVTPGGTGLNPPMPWQDFAQLTDADAHAIAAYMKTVPAVKHQVPDRKPPGTDVQGSILVFPPPSDWDAPRQAPAGK